MTAHLDHLIIHATNYRSSARFLGDLLGIQPAVVDGPFAALHVGNLTLDFMASPNVVPQHYAFVVDNDHFDRAVQQLAADHHPIFADPMHERCGIEHHPDGRRNCYLSDPDHHNIELLTPQP